MHRQLDNFPEALHSVEDAQLSRGGAIVDPVHKVLALGRHLAKEHKEGDEVAVEGHEFPEAEREGLQAPEVAVNVLAKEAFADEDQPVLGQLPKVLQNARKGNYLVKLLINRLATKTSRALKNCCAIKHNNAKQRALMK